MCKYIEHIIKSGDTLWGLSSRYYGNPKQWVSLFADNITVLNGNPHMLYVGDVLHVKRRPLSRYKQIHMQLDYWRGNSRKYQERIWKLEDELLPIVVFRWVFMLVTILIVFMLV